jgi:hypothetical protein
MEAEMRTTPEATAASGSSAEKALEAPSATTRAATILILRISSKRTSYFYGSQSAI